MIQSKYFFRLLTSNNISFFAGVPDSVLSPFCSCLYSRLSSQKHIIAANEGGAVALAAGYYLASGALPLVYMQNAGLGNAVNPLTSLVNKEVYGTPMILLIGWRGEPRLRQAQGFGGQAGTRDEPQHTKEGESLLPLLRSLGIPFAILPGLAKQAEQVITKAVRIAKKRNTPYALVVRRGTFESFKKGEHGGQEESRVNFLNPRRGRTKFAPRILGIRDLQKFMRDSSLKLFREEVIEIILDYTKQKDVIVATTGKTNRELFELRERRNESHRQDFLNIGAMGHASMIALGIAIAKPKRVVWCLDGDGAFLMHMGALGTIGSQNVVNLKHIILNNGAHESVGGHPTVGFTIDIPAIAVACGYRWAVRVATKKDLSRALAVFSRARGPALLEVCIRQGSRQDLGRPTMNPRVMKRLFVNFLR